MIRGRVCYKPPGEFPHATSLSRVNFVLTAHLDHDWASSLGLLTRWSEDSDFSTDYCFLRRGTDPETGWRHIESLAFEVIYEPTHEVTHLWRQEVRDRSLIYRHTPEEVRKRAQEISLRGVVLYGLFVEREQVCRWSPEASDWQPVGTEIEHEAFVRPLPVKALLDEDKADDAVYEALAGKADFVFAAMAAKRVDKMVRSAKIRAIGSVLTARGLALSEKERAKICSCYEDERLDRWISQAAVVARVRNGAVTQCSAEAAFRQECSPQTALVVPPLWF
jgi:hypothetical protein